MSASISKLACSMHANTALAAGLCLLITLWGAIHLDVQTFAGNIMALDPISLAHGTIRTTITLYTQYQHLRSLSRTDKDVCAEIERMMRRGMGRLRGLHRHCQQCYAKRGPDAYQELLDTMTGLQIGLQKAVRAVCARGQNKSKGLLLG